MPPRKWLSIAWLAVDSIAEIALRSFSRISGSEILPLRAGWHQEVREVSLEQTGSEYTGQLYPDTWFRLIPVVNWGERDGIF
jgi:hypothetical protein